MVLTSHLCDLYSFQEKKIHRQIGCVYGAVHAESLHNKQTSFFFKVLNFWGKKFKGSRCFSTMFPARSEFTGQHYGGRKKIIC